MMGGHGGNRMPSHPSGMAHQHSPRQQQQQQPQPIPGTLCAHNVSSPLLLCVCAHALKLHICSEKPKMNVLQLNF